MHTNRGKLLIMIGEDHLHVTEKGAVQEQSLVENRILMFQHQKKTSLQTKNFLFERQDSNHLITDVREPKYFIFSRRTP